MFKFFFQVQLSILYIYKYIDKIFKIDNSKIYYKLLWVLRKKIVIILYQSIVLVLIYTLMPNFLYFSFYIYLVIILYIYSILNIYWYFINLYKTTNYSSIIQKFWKRAYGVFWLIELGLLFIFVFLELIASKEVELYNRINTNIHKDAYIISEWIYQISIHVYLFFILSKLIILKKGNLYYTNLYLMSYTSNLTIYVLYESIKFFITIQYTTNFKEFFFKKNIINSSNFIIDSICTNEFNLLDTNSKVFYNSKINHFILLEIIKYWHIILVYIYAILTIYKQNNNKLSYDNLAVLVNNSVFLLLFCNIIIIFVIQQIFFLIIKIPYTWFIPTLSYKYLLHGISEEFYNFIF